MDDKLPKPQQLNIELSEEVAQGIYSNLAVITHSSSEFVVDFVRIMPGIPKANVKSRIILTPEHAKRLLMALQDNIKKYEAVHGPIKKVNPGSDPMMPPLNFGDLQHRRNNIEKREQIFVPSFFPSNIFETEPKYYFSQFFLSFYNTWLTFQKENLIFAATNYLSVSFLAITLIKLNINKSTDFFKGNFGSIG
jgi:hypothetical protein